MNTTDLKFRPKLDLERPRTLTSRATEAPTPPSTPVPKEEAIEVFAELEATAAKADTLMTAVQQALATLTVPVRPEDTDIVAAVLRKDPTSGGAYITFDLYMRALAFEADAFDLQPGEVNGLFSGHKFTDTKHLQALALSKATKLPESDCKIIQSQIMYLYILQLMQMGLQSMECEKQTSTKTTVVAFGSELPPLLASTIFSIAFQLAYSSNLIEDLKQFMEESAGNAVKPSQLNMNDVFAQAKSMKLPELRMLQLSLRSKDPEDYEIIRDYARAFVRRTKKIGYEPWVMADDIFLLQQNLRRSLRQKDRYINGPSQFSSDISKILRYRAQQYSNGLDHIATALCSTDTVQATVCSLQWLVRLTDAPLLLMKAIYSFVLSAKELALAKIYLPGVSFDASIIEAVVHDLLELTLMVGKKLVCWFQRDPEIWAILEQCPAIAEMVDCAIDGIENMEEEVFGMLEAQLGHDRSIIFAIRIKAQILLEMKKVKMMLSKLEFILDAARLNREVFSDLKIRFDVDKEIFGNATKIPLILQKKAEHVGDFVKQQYKSEFLTDIDEPLAEAGTLPVGLVLVPFQCGGDKPSLAPPDAGVLERVAEAAGVGDLIRRGREFVP